MANEHGWEGMVHEFMNSDQPKHQGSGPPGESWRFVLTRDDSWGWYYPRRRFTEKIFGIDEHSKTGTQCGGKEMGRKRPRGEGRVPLHAYNRHNLPSPHPQGPGGGSIRVKEQPQYAPWAQLNQLFMCAGKTFKSKLQPKLCTLGTRQKNQGRTRKDDRLHFATAASKKSEWFPATKRRGAPRPRSVDEDA